MSARGHQARVCGPALGPALGMPEDVPDGARGASPMGEPVDRAGPHPIKHLVLVDTPPPVVGWGPMIEIQSERTLRPKLAADR